MRLADRWGCFRDLKVAQQVFGNGQEAFFVWRHKPVIADFDEIFRQYMLQEPMDKIKYGKSVGLPLIGVTVFKAEGHLLVFEFFDAVVCNSDPVDVRGQVF